MSNEKNTSDKQEQVLTEQASWKITDLDLDQAVGGAGRVGSQPGDALNITIDPKDNTAYARKLPPGLDAADVDWYQSTINALVKSGFSVVYLE